MFHVKHPEPRHDSNGVPQGVSNSRGPGGADLVRHGGSAHGLGPPDWTRIRATGHWLERAQRRNEARLGFADDEVLHVSTAASGLRPPAPAAVHPSLGEAITNDAVLGNDLRLVHVRRRGGESLVGCRSGYDQDGSSAHPLRLRRRVAPWLPRWIRAKGLLRLPPPRSRRVGERTKRVRPNPWRSVMAAS